MGSWAVWSQQTGEGLRISFNGSTFYNYEWCRHSFNPAMQDQSFPLTASNINTIYFYDSSDGFSRIDWNPYNPTGYFDLTNFQSGNEVVMATVVLYADHNMSATTYTNSWKDPTNTLLSFSYTYSLPAGSSGAGYWSIAWSTWGMGVRGRNNREIDANGTWKAYTIVNGTGATTETSFTIANLDTTQVTTYVNVGYLWVDGTQLCFTNGNGNATKIKEDTAYSGGSTSAANAGSVWINSTSGDYHLYYVGSDGTIRRTKKGSHYEGRTDFFGAALPTTSTANAGDMWTDTADDQFLYMVMQDGYIVRIGSSYVGSTDIQ